MTIAWATDARNDIFTRPGGRLAIVRGLDAVLQQCEHAIKAQAGEMIFDANRGVTTEQSVFDGSVNLLSFEASARAALQRIPDVVEVVAFDSDFLNNTLTYQANIRTVFGEGVVSNGGL